ncbi:TetR/AcrR family transcriptional regulator [Microbacteriaceae bacterium VKM Ac-2854]|nr:TetR/AcrR family transcriptional regulator [Microbacteriaceae bacterium VKM Ac-2854]
MPKVTPAHRDARRAEITAAALRCFAEKGFQRTSMADIIAEAGLSAGAIYGHFPSKQDIVLSVADRILAERSAGIDAAAQSAAVPTPGRVLLDALGGVSSELLGTRLLVQLWGEATTDPGLAELVQGLFARLRRAWVDYLRAWAVSGGRLDDDGATAWAEERMPLLLGLAQGFIVQSALLPEFDDEAYIRGVDALLAQP